MCLSVHCPIYTRLQDMSPKILQKRTILCRLDCHSSTDRVWHRLMILLKASRLPLLNRIWTMSKYGPCWLHHCIYWRERQVLTDHELITPSRENPVSSSSHFRESTGRLVARESTEKPVLGSSVRDLQRQLDSNRLEIHCTNHGSEESRKEQARLHEELAQRERVLRKRHNQKYSRSGRSEEGSGSANRRILQGQIERKSRYNTGAHRSSLYKYRSCRKEWLLILMNVKM